MRLMMQSLLKERLGPIAHFRAQNTPVLEMSLSKPGKLGPKLRHYLVEPITLDPVKAQSMPVLPTRKEFLALAKEHTLVPVCRTLTADLETPVSAFLRAAWQERECFLLESVEGGEQVGRYTFIGVQPYKRIVARGRAITTTEGRRVTRSEGDVFAVLREALSGHKPARLKGLPPFTAGAVGFFSCSSMRCWPSTMCVRRSGWW
jgi:hypothetical protein